ncbi:MAG: hypothetical protein H7Y27_00190, partial [Gemmatimonadaceae bacterium]|nr:hypothetical protein [Chitinophagaceae bacterium]
MEKFFTAIYAFFEKRRTALFTVMLLSYAVVGFFASRIKLEEDISSILPRDKKIDQLNEIFQNSRFLDKLVVNISLADSLAPPQPDSLVSFAGTFAETIRTDLSTYVTGVQDRA